MKEKIRKVIEILYKIALCGVVFVIIWFLAAMIYGGHSLGKFYDECMERCVSENKSNEIECSNSCD